MPCYDPMTDPARVVEYYDRRDDDLRERLNRSTRLLCAAVRELRARGVDLAEIHDELPDWAEAHDRDDARREASS